MDSEPETGVRGATSRRALFVAAGGVGAGAVLAACGADGRDGTDRATGSGPPATGPTAPDAGASGGSGDSGGEQGPVVLASVQDVAVGGGMINAYENVVVTQPAEGEFRGFSATCTHQGCQVSAVSDGMISCFCHGSQYSIEDGSVVRAAPGRTPDTQGPLEEVAVTVEDGSVLRA